MTRQRILFVDDEAMVLRALERELRAYSDRWDMTFAASGEEALAHLCAGSFDVLVTDMVMPRIDGATLLRRAVEQWPSMVRIVLSGHGEFEQAVRSVPYAHQRLPKPWTRDVLLGTLERACGLRALVTDDALRSRISRVGSLPSSTDSYMRLLWVLDAEEANFSSVAAVIEEDMAMSARVLQLANSAFVAARCEVSTVAQAVRTVGLEAIRQYLLNPFLNVFDVFTPSSGAQGSQFARLERHAALTARLARVLARDAALASKAFLAGLVHDLGKLLIVARMPDVSESMRQEAAEKDCPVEHVEQRRLGVTHAEIGAYLLGLWGIPDELVDAVARHHERGAGRAGELASILRLADWLAGEHEARRQRQVQDDGVLVLDFDEALLRSLGVLKDIPRLLGLAERCAEDLDRVARTRSARPALPAIGAGEDRPGESNRR